MHVLLNTLNTKLLGFEYVKELYPNDTNFGEIYFQYELVVTNELFRHDRFLFKDKRLCVPNYSLCKLPVREAHSGRLIAQFRITKTLEVLYEYFYWPNMKKDVQTIYNRCITCKQAKSKVMPHELYIPLHVFKES